MRQIFKCVCTFHLPVLTSRCQPMKRTPLVLSRRSYEVFPVTKSWKESGPMGYFLLLVPLTTFGLGTWQVYRRQWKLNLIKELEEKTKAAPIDLPEDLRELRNLEYRRIKVTGRFDHSRELYVSPRSRVVSGGMERTNFMSPGQTGSFVVTPFILSDRDLTILVNRGWVPRKMTLPSTRPAGQIDGEVTLTGIVRHTEKRPPFGAKNSPESQYWFFRDVERMSYLVNAAPVFIDATEDCSAPGGPCGGQTRVTLRNEHFSYILTWYSLSAATAFLWYRKFLLGKPIV